jgi:hypothetical protein
MQRVTSPIVAAILITALLGLAITGAFLTSHSRPAYAPVVSADPSHRLHVAMFTGIGPETSLLALTCTTGRSCPNPVTAKCEGPGAPTEQQLIGCQDYTITGRPAAPTNSGHAQWDDLFTTFSAIFGLATPGPAAESEILSRLFASGTEIDPADAGGQLTRAGRAYSKAGEVFGTTSGGPASINEAGQSALKKILYGRDTAVFPMTGGRFEGGYRFVLPDGLGAVFSPSGTLQYFGKFAQ